MPGDAKAALDRPGEDKGLLDQVRVVGRSQPFYRDYLRPVQIGHLRDTGKGRPVVHDHRAGAALALSIAGLLRPGKPEAFSEQIKKNAILFDNELAGHTVDLHYHLFHVPFSFPPRGSLIPCPARDNFLKRDRNRGLPARPSR